MVGCLPPFLLRVVFDGAGWLLFWRTYIRLPIRQLEVLALAKVEEASAALGEKGKKGKKKQQQQQEAEEQEAAVVVGTCLELYARLPEVSPCAIA